MTRRPPFLAIAAAICVTACGDGRGPPSTVRDTAGVELVESFRPSWGDESAWAIDPVPRVRVSAWSPPSERDSLHLVDATRLPDGRFVVANGATGELGWFGKSGETIRIVGGKGTQRGLHESLRHIHVIDDAVWAFDGMGRWNVFDLEGELLRTMYLEPNGRGWQVVEPLDRSRVLLVANIPSHGLATVSGRHRRPMPIRHYTLDGVELDTSVVVPGPEITVLITDGRHTYTSGLFDRRTVVHGGGDRYYVGLAERPEIEVYDPRGSLIRVVRLQGLDLAILQEEWEELVRRRTTSLEERGEAGLVEEMRELPRRTTYPAYTRFLEDAAGYLWVAEYDGTSQPNLRNPASRWLVLDPEGRWLGRLMTPEGLHIVEIGSDYVLGLARAPSGSEARLHRLER